MYELLTLFTGFVFLYSITAGGIARTPISGAIVFALFGWLIGPAGLDVLTISATTEGLRMLAELTLALVLFTDAANANLTVLRRSIGLPQRLLLLGLPLTILLGFGVGVALFDNLSWLEIAILATILAPTDAALGAAVVSNRQVPDNIREGLNVESGLNDGICVPILFALLAFVEETPQEMNGTQLTLLLIGEEIGIGLLVGITLSLAGVIMLRFTEQRGWVTHTWHQLPVVALAFGCFATAQMLGGSGFIASFSGGLLFGALATAQKESLLLAAEGTGETLGLVTWVIFGSLVLGHVRDGLTWEIFLYALLSLTVIRMLPVFLVLTGSGLRTAEKLFTSWFGPRGMASIVFGIIVLDEALPNGNILVQTVVATVVLSILCHGLSANPLISVLAKRLGSRWPG
jgi:sodium/hydrogen antiporter